MNCKLLTGSLLTASVLLAACGNGEENKENKTEETNKVKEKVTTEKPTTEAPTSEVPTTETPMTEAPTTEIVTTEVPTTEKPVTVNINNVTSRSQLESILYNNSISEIDKIAAYNSAVRNGVIPQGNVMEGPALAAYQSSLRVESGAEKSVYQSNPYPDNPNSQKYDDLYQETENSSNNEDPEAGLTSGERQTKYLIENGMYDGPNSDEIYQKILDKMK
ncbi:hypothetical protein QNJ28_00485 [Macrococcus caseolyticus]|uniref:hypothetical protein n=1 Tax=Macrococcoides caseolyticum TaxID=69966 RepID=UPI0024BC81B5|nr:hypothetical protein [Macrococcus caseolyticus]MDJ1108562.1 hypothetical protein [Macrococcus caseolyticus]